MCNKDSYTHVLDENATIRFSRPKQLVLAKTVMKCVLKGCVGVIKEENAANKKALELISDLRNQDDLLIKLYTSYTFGFMELLQYRLANVSYRYWTKLCSRLE